MAPTTLTVQQGANGTSTVNINRTNGFAGAVTLTATGLPNGVTAAFNPTAPTTNYVDADADSVRDGDDRARRR